MKLIHLILAQNSWLNNIEMLHTLILSRPGVGKTTLALYYLPHISKRWKYADRSRMTIPGLLGGYDQVAKETRVGALKSADRGVMVIDEVDKFRNVDKDIIIALNTVMSNGHVSITIGNSSRSLDYQTRPNIMLLGNYSSGKLKKQLEYATDEFEKEKLKEEFIAKEMMEITQHISTFDRIAILDTDIFEYTADSEKEANLLFDSWFESKEEAENEEPTERELRLLKLIRNIMIYNANYIDKKKLRESIKKFKAEIASFIANEELKEEKHRLSNNLMRLIEVIAVLKGEQEVGRETVELAFTLASISRKYKQIYSLKTEELEEYVEEFIEEKIIRELPADGIDVETARRKFRESLSISKFTEIERKELMKLFDTMLREFAQRSEIEIKDNNIRIGQKRLSEALRKLLQYYDSLAIKKKSIGEYYYDIQELADQLKVSSQVALELLKLIAIDDIKRTSIKVDGEVRYVYHVEIDTEKVKDMLNKNAYKNILLNFFI
ncbi:AAA family ATPase [Thermococcus peptonophilus]|uniref:AAA family ATPase n=1 Tax=Thermococcus peptonophilus TaxID=53952 RepID=UPI000AF18C3E